MIYDLMLAAQALRLGTVLVTHNTAEFARVPNLTVEDWQSRSATSHMTKSGSCSPREAVAGG
jgi:hypothetical protein